MFYLISLLFYTSWAHEVPLVPGNSSYIATILQEAPFMEIYMLIIIEWNRKVTRYIQMYANRSIWVSQIGPLTWWCD